MEKFGLFNVVWYDCCSSSAYVSKFILSQNHGDISEETVNHLVEYLEGNGELLKVDYLYPLSFDNIIAMETSDDVEKKIIVDRFKYMYFTNE